MAGEDWVDTVVRCPSCSEVLFPEKRIQSFTYCPCCGKHAKDHPIPKYCPGCGVTLKDDPVLTDLLNNEEEEEFDFDEDEEN